VSVVDRSHPACPGLLTFRNPRLASAVPMLVVIALLATFPGWREEIDYDDNGEVIDEREVKPFPAKGVRNGLVLLSLVGTILSLVAALWQHSAAAAAAATIRFLTNEEVTARVGTAATVLVWINFGIFLVVAGMITMLAISMAMLDRTTE